MSFSHLPFSSSTTPLSSSQMAAAAAATTPSPPSAPRGACCENGRPVMTDPHTGQTVCSCQYGSALLQYPRLSGLTPSNLFPPSPYSSPASSAGYMGLGSEGSAFYPLSSGGTRESSDAWRPLPQPFDYPAMGFYPYSAASYGGLDLNARRKNATRESTNTLKAWLQEHIKNPYPTKGEKIMLAIITKMTLTQVSTWFANARRRLKKENKMTWSPRNRSEDGDVNSQGEDNDEDEGDEEGDGKRRKGSSGEGKDGGGDDVRDEEIDVGADHPTDLSTAKVTSALTPPPLPVTSSDKGPALGALFPEEDCVSPVPSVGEDSRSRLSPPQSRDSDSTFSSEGLPHTELEDAHAHSKPKIWSVTDFLHTAGSKAALKYDRADSAAALMAGAHAQRNASAAAAAAAAAAELGAMMAPPPPSAVPTNYGSSSVSSNSSSSSSLLPSFPSALGYTAHTYSSFFGSQAGSGKVQQHHQQQGVGGRPNPATRFGPYPVSRPGDHVFPASRDIGSIREGE